MRGLIDRTGHMGYASSLFWEEVNAAEKVMTHQGPCHLQQENIHAGRQELLTAVVSAIAAYARLLSFA